MEWPLPPSSLFHFLFSFHFFVFYFPFRLLVTRALWPLASRGATFFCCCCSQARLGQRLAGWLADSEEAAGHRPASFLPVTRLEIHTKKAIKLTIEAWRKKRSMAERAKTTTGSNNKEKVADAAPHSILHW